MQFRLQLPAEGIAFTPLGAKLPNLFLKLDALEIALVDLGHRVHNGLELVRDDSSCAPVTRRWLCSLVLMRCCLCRIAAACLALCRALGGAALGRQRGLDLFEATRARFDDARRREALDGRDAPALSPEELQELRERLRLGGRPKRIERQHAQGKLTARERIDLLLDEGEPSVEVGMLVAHDLYDGQAPGAGVVTTVGRVEGREVVVVANDGTVKAGSWWPETITKILRAQEIAMRCRIPIIYLVDSAGVNLPYQGGVFPGQYGAARIFYYNSIMRRYLRIPQLAAVMGPCIAGGAYLPALSDVILMVEGSSFMGLGGPNLVKGATGQVVGSEELGGAKVHTEVSGVAHYMVPDDEACIARLRQLVSELPVEVEHTDREAADAEDPHQRLGEIAEQTRRVAPRAHEAPLAQSRDGRVVPVHRAHHGVRL